MINDWQFPSGATQAGSYRGYKSGGDEPNSSSFEDQAGAEATLGGSSQRSRRVEVSGLDGRPTPGSAIHSARRKDGLDMDTLQGRIALVSGGSRGIGAAVSLALAEAGCDIALNFRSRISEAEEVATKIRAHGRRATTVQSDVSQAVQVHAMVQRVAKELGQVSILVNNAGIAGRTLPLWELDVRDFDDVYAVNLRGVFLCCRAVIRGMLERSYGRIVSVASVAGKEGNPNMSPYSSTKAAVIGLTKSLAKEVAGKGNITVNCISPAVIRTKILDGLAPETVQYMVSRIPIGRTGTIEEVASLVQFLASREASFTTGQCYDISGGRCTY